MAPRKNYRMMSMLFGNSLCVKIEKRIPFIIQFLLLSVIEKLLV